jgi:hypothetical protein
MQWDSSTEKLLSVIADEAQIRSILHHNCHLHYKFWSTLIQIPVIVLSTITGGGNFISSSFAPYKDMLIMIIGGISIFIAAISTVYKYLDLDKIVEGHRLSSHNWNKLYNDIRNQLTITVQNRQSAADLLRIIKGDYDRLNEISPIVPQTFVADVKEKIGSSDFERPYYVGNLRHLAAHGAITVASIETEINNVIKASAATNTDALVLSSATAAVTVTNEPINEIKVTE